VVGQVFFFCATKYDKLNQSED